MHVVKATKRMEEIGGRMDCEIRSVLYLLSGVPAVAGGEVDGRCKTRSGHKGLVCWSISYNHHHLASIQSIYKMMQQLSFVSFLLACVLWLGSRCCFPLQKYRVTGGIVFLGFIGLHTWSLHSSATDRHTLLITRGGGSFELGKWPSFNLRSNRL